jgi:CheY-like chemotaxis protein
VNAFQLLPTCPDPAAPAFRAGRATAGGIVECATVLPVEGGTALLSHDGVEIDAERAVERLRRESLAMHRIVLADDHPVVRQSLKRILNQQADFDLVGETDNGLETLGLVKQLQPDLLVTDLMMPGLNGLEVARRVRLSFPATRIVVVSVNADEPYVTGAFRCGANAFVLKTACGRHLVPAIRAALAGHRYVSPPLTEPVL